jgi:hypothetical protein
VVTKQIVEKRGQSLENFLWRSSADNFRQSGTNAAAGPSCLQTVKTSRRSTSHEALSGAISSPPSR